MKAISNIRDTELRLDEIEFYRGVIAHIDAGNPTPGFGVRFSRRHYQFLLLNAMQSLRDDVRLARYIVELANTPDDQIPSEREINDLRRELKGEG